MGIFKLRKFIDQYLSTERKNIDKQQINSDVCYIDFTSKIILSTSSVSRNISTTDTTLELINRIIDKNVEAIVNQIRSNRYYTKYILAFDYRYITSTSSKLKFSKRIIDNYVNKLETMKERIDIVPMIPINLTSSSFSVMEKGVRNLYEVRYNYWKPEKKLLDYISLKYLIDNTPVDDPIRTTYIKCLESGHARYMLLRGAKNEVRTSRNKTNYTSKTKTVKSDISMDLYNSENFDAELKKYLSNIPYTLIISLIPTIVKRIKDLLFDIDIEFIGCENESDFAIRKCIKENHPNDCPTVYSRDTDLLMLLSDINCVIKFPYQNHNVSIYPIRFWTWLLKQDYTFKDVVNVCSVLGTDYNQYRPRCLKIADNADINSNLLEEIREVNRKEISKETIPRGLSTYLLATEIYLQSDNIENDIHHIRPHELDMDLINMKFSNLYTDLLFGDD